MIHDLFTKPVLIFGCGNVLFGDDGFGPAVIEYLHEHYRIPDHAMAMDAGTSIRNFLFDLMLSPKRPKRIFIVDAVSRSSYPAGYVFELDLAQLPEQKVNDFSLHQFPSVNLLRELRDQIGIEVRVLVVQAGHVPEEVLPGISDEVRCAVPKACEWLMQQIEGLQ